MKSIFLTIARYLSEIAASEAGELLSVRRKWHLLEAERYARLEVEAVKEKRNSMNASGNRRRAARHIHGTLGVAPHA